MELSKKETETTRQRKGKITSKENKRISKINPRRREPAPPKEKKKWGKKASVA